METDEERKARLDKMVPTAVLALFIGDVGVVLSTKPILNRIHVISRLTRIRVASRLIRTYVAAD